MLPAIAKRNAASSRSVSVFCALTLLLAIFLTSAWAAQPDRIVGTIDTNQTVALKGNVSSKVQHEADKGPVDPSTKLPFVTLLIQPSVEQQAALKQLLAEQQDPSSPNYHKWLTPEQFGQRFGLSSGDISKITEWLRSQGFKIVQVARGRDWIAFSGTVAQIQRTFHTELHRYNADGEERFANATEPTIPKALEGVVAGLRGLNNFRFEPMNVKKSNAAITADYFSGGGNNYLAPGDIATIYDIGPLYNAGINGTGMKIAIMGQTDIDPADIAQFRSAFGLSANVPQQILAAGCSDPGTTGDLIEADIDLEWSGAVARNATIVFVKCDTKTNNGVITATLYAIDNNVAPVISISYGGCEPANGQSNALLFQTWVQKANTEGITVIASTGDSGAAGCDSSGSSSATQGLEVNIPASIPEVTAVGGTEFNEGSGNYWGTSNGANGGSALSYIPELGWDDNSTGTGFDPHLGSTGGGASIYFPKPSWQTGPGVPSNNFRNVPDVAISASADHDGYIVCSSGNCANGIQITAIYGGTSVSTPVFAGIVTLLNQQVKNTPPGVGNINTTLYQFAQSVPTAFHDAPAGNYNNGGAANPSGNTVPCTQGSTSCPTKAPFQFGFRTGTGYDQVTGLGSVDAHVFVNNWASVAKIPTTTTVTLSPASVIVGATGPVAAKATVTHATGTGTPTGSVNFYVDGSTTVAGTGTLTSASYTFNYDPSKLAAGNHTISATYEGDSDFASSTSPGSTLGVQDFRVTPNPATITITAPGQSGMTTLTTTPLGGFSQTLTYSCGTLPAEATCGFVAASATSETLTIATTAPSSRLKRSPFDRRAGIFYALLLPGFLGLVSVVNRKRARRGIRLLSLIAVLAAATLWMPACGGGSGTPSNPGTPKGTSTVTVTATTGGTSPLTHTATITLTVQ